MLGDAAEAWGVSHWMGVQPRPSTDTTDHNSSCSAFGELSERNWLILRMEGHKLCISCTPLYTSFHYFCSTSVPRCHSCNPRRHCAKNKNPNLPLPDRSYNGTSACSTLHSWDQPAGWEPSPSAWSRMVLSPAHCHSTDAGELRLTQILRQPQAKLWRALPINLWLLPSAISPWWGVLPFEVWLCWAFCLWPSWKEKLS